MPGKRSKTPGGGTGPIGPSGARTRREPRCRTLLPKEDAMPDDRRDDRIAGHTIRFSWNDGPTRGETHEHVFHTDGSVEYHKLGGKPGEATREKRYASARVTDDVSVVS